MGHGGPPATSCKPQAARGRCAWSCALLATHGCIIAMKK
ncbi:hypothetical protein BN844_4263 [Pseudomonas sp. SHC52]|nr:hypothetical protein BN844_4263 [Pseudomonas sp. SHC52]